MRKVDFFTKSKKIKGNIQREMHAQMDLLEHSYLVEDKTHFQHMGAIQYVIIFAISFAVEVLFIYFFCEENNTYIQKFFYCTLICIMAINMFYFVFDAILCYLYKKDKDNLCLWNVILCCQKIVGYLMLVICAEATLWCVLASLIFKRIHMEKLQKNSIGVVFSFVMSFMLTVTLGVLIFRYTNIDIFWRERNGYFYLTIIFLAVFWMVYKLLLRWCCTHIGIADDFEQVVEETKVVLFFVFMGMFIIVYGIDWSIRDETEPIMQSVANAITVALLADTIAMKAKGNE